jgi:hypothetical protein
MPEIDFTFLGCFLTLCFVLVIVSLLITALPAWAWFILLLFIAYKLLFGDKK